MVEADDVADLVQRDGAHVVDPEGAALRVERSDGHGGPENVPVLVPFQVGLAGALDLELDAPAKGHLGVSRVAAEVEPDWHACGPPLGEGAADSVDEARLEVGDGPGCDVDAHRIAPAVVPAMQHRVLAGGDDFVEIRNAGAGPDTAARLRPGRRSEERRV